MIHAELNNSTKFNEFIEILGVITLRTTDKYDVKQTLDFLTLVLVQPFWLVVFIGSKDFKSNGEYIDKRLLESGRDSECFYRYMQRDHHQSFAEWLHKKNASHYTPIAPIYQQSLLNLQ
ncbi:hypothetical protein LOAG_11529, partial [Loa loa]